MGKLAECTKCGVKATMNGMGKTAKAAAKAGKWTCVQCLNNSK
jgi:hypothetical protein